MTVTRPAAPCLIEGIEIYLNSKQEYKHRFAVEQRATKIS